MKKNNRPTSNFGMWSFAILSVLFLLSVSTQVFLAGLATFVNPADYWDKHTMFIHIFEMLPILMLIIAFATRMPDWTKVLSAIALALIFAMYFTANITSVLPWAAAAHPVIAMIIFWVTIKMTRQAFQLISMKKGE